MWIVSLILGIVFAVLGVADLVVGAEHALIMLIAGGLWLKVAALEKALYA
jgi:hypothetical protein